MINGLSINGTWPAGLMVALGVVLLTILAVRVFGRGARRGDHGRGASRPPGPKRAELEGLPRAVAYFEPRCVIVVLVVGGEGT